MKQKLSVNQLEFLHQEEKIGISIGCQRPATRDIVCSMGGHFPIILKVNKGVLMVVFRTGDFHVGPSGTLSIALSCDSGHSWSRPIVVADSGPDNRNPSIIQMNNGKIALLYISLDAYDLQGKYCPEKAKFSTFITFTRDYLHWTDPIQINTGSLKGNGYGRMVELPNGSILLAFYGQHEINGQYESWVFQSNDGGLNFSPLSCIAKGFSETTLLCLPSGRILAMIRRDPEDEMWQCESDDGGSHWSVPRQILKKSLAPADLLYLTNGYILMTYGHRLPPYGVRAIISKDEGKTWNYEKEITLVADARSWDCGYPSSVQLDDDTVYTVYYSGGGNNDICEYARGAIVAGIRYRLSDICS